MLAQAVEFEYECRSVVFVISHESLIERLWVSSNEQ